MRRGGADFMAFVVARWPGLVREVVELGVPVDDARAVVTDALDRCRPEWLEAQRYGDIDAVVESAVHRSLSRYDGPRDAAVEERFDPGPPPTEADLDQLAWQRRARTNSRAVLVLAPLVVLALAATWWATRSDDEAALGQARLTQVENPSVAVWYAAGELHLPHGTLAVRGLVDATRIADGVVYADTSGRVVSLAPDGTRVVLGRQEPGAPLRASDESGWVAWVDPAQGETEVVDVVTGRAVATRAGDREVIAVDGDTVYVRDAGDQLRAWQPDTDTTATLEEQDLLDVLGRKKAVQSSPGHVEVVQSLFAVDFTFPGTGARLSSDGNLLTTRGPHGEVTLDDTRSGREVSVELGEESVVAAAGSGRGAATYVVDTADGRRLLRDCDLRTRVCETAAEVDRSAAVPLLAR